MNPDVLIKHLATDGGGQYEARVEDSDATGLLTYRRRDANTVVADHTLVPDALGGRGVASALVQQLIADAREQGFKIVPECSFVKAQFERNADWSNLRAT